MDCSYPQRKIRDHGTIRDYDGFELDVQFYLERILGLGNTDIQQEIQIVTPMVEQIVINHMWIKEIVGRSSSGQTCTCLT